MKKPLFYTLVIILFLQTPFCLLMALGAMVSKKYEVDEMYWQIENNKQLPTSERSQQATKLDKRGNQLEMKSTLLTVIACSGFICASGLLIKRKSIIVDTKSST